MIDTYVGEPGDQTSEALHESGHQLARSRTCVKQTNSPEERRDETLLEAAVGGRSRQSNKHPEGGDLHDIKLHKVAGGCTVKRTAR